MPENLMLRSSLQENLDGVSHWARVTDLKQHRVLYSPGETVSDVYYVDSGLVSLLSASGSGHAVETAAIGSGGIVGANVMLGSDRARTQAIVRIPGLARRMPTAQFRRLVDVSPAFRKLVSGSLDSQFHQVQQNALCNAFHSIEARFCRWVLTSADALGGNMLEVKQDFCAYVLGVQRTSLSMVAHSLQCAGAIRTLRGKLHIVDRAKLETTACECYARLKALSPPARALAARSPLPSPQQDGAFRESETPGPGTYAA